MAKKSKGAKVERLDATKSTFILQHFLTEGKKMLLPPKVKYQKIGDALKIEISFSTGQQPESGRIFWMYDRPPEGTIAYIKEDFPVENFKEMIMSSDRRTFSVQVPLKIRC